MYSKEELGRKYRRLEMKIHNDYVMPFDDEEFKKSVYGDKYDPDYDKKRAEKLKKRFGKDYIEDFELKLWNKKL